MDIKSYKYFNVTSPSEWIAHVEINRPDKLNAFFEGMWLEMRVIFESLSQDSSVRVIVFSGAGDRAFTAGLDVQAATAEDSPIIRRSDDERDGARWANALRRFAAEFQECVSSLEKCEKPVICVLHGYAYGLAIDMSTCADIRLCTYTTRFAVKEVDIGLAADIGTLTRLPKVVGSFSWIKDVCLTARVFDAEEALRVGLVSGVFPTKQDAMNEGFKIAAVIAQKSPVAIQGTKEFLNWSRDHTISDGLRYTAVWNGAALQTEDVAVAINSGVQPGVRKCSPRFEKL